MMKKQDSSDVTLVPHDDLLLHAHKVILAPASANGKTMMLNEQKNNEVVEQMELNRKWTEGEIMELPHYLREDKIEATLKKHAQIDVEPHVIDYKGGGDCVTIHAAVGATTRCVSL